MTLVKTLSYSSIILRGHELAKHYRGRDRLIALERARSEEIRLHDEVNRNSNRIQSPEYGSGRMQNYYMQTESQFATEGKISNSDFFPNYFVLFQIYILFSIITF